MRNQDTQPAGDVVLATMHGKEAVIAPIVREQLGLTVWTPNDFDTDQFGTFTREKVRQGTQLEAARAKARAAIEQYGYSIGLASEGSFGPHPQIPMLQSNLELVVLLDDRYGVEVVGCARNSHVVPKTEQVTSPEHALAVATAWGFSEQGIIVRRSAHLNRHIHKDILTAEDLLAAVARELRWPWVRRVVIETDMRAHRNPKRLGGIAAATYDLVARYQKQCPQCAAPGFVGVAVATTAMCERCRLLTEVPHQETCVCQVCAYREECMVPGASATVDPGRCARCNP